MKKYKPHPEEIFYKDITRLIYNLLIDNINYQNGYYNGYGAGNSFVSLLEDTKERALYILERIEDEKHLINLS